MRIAIACFPVCVVINFEINLIFLIKFLLEKDVHLVWSSLDLNANQKQPPSRSIKKAVLKSFALSKRKHLSWSLNLIKLKVSSLPVNIAKF